MRKERARYIAAMAIFGTIGLVRRWIPCSSGVVALARAVIGTLFLGAWSLMRRERVHWAALKGNAPGLLVSGILLGANWICLFEAYRYTSVSVATICYYMAPVLVILVSPLLFHERLGARQIACAAVAAVGMALVSGVLENGGAAASGRGIALGLAAALMYASIVLLNKSIRGLTALERTLAQLLIAAVSMLPYVLLTENVSEWKLTPSSAGLLLTAGVVHTGIAYALYFDSIARLPAQTSALWSYLDPALSVLLSMTVLRDPMTPAAVIGAVMVIGAMAAEAAAPVKRKHPNKNLPDRE